MIGRIPDGAQGHQRCLKRELDEETRKKVKDEKEKWKEREGQKRRRRGNAQVVEQTKSRSQ
ncbi:MAG: hypothetical protein ACK518_01275 [bacterium]